MSNIEHATWSLERTYPAPRARVFAAWADVETKRRWFVDDAGRPDPNLSSDFVVGGIEQSHGTMPNGKTYSYRAVIHDIVPDERIITAYELVIDERRISVTLTTVELVDDGDGTRLTYTEQGAFLDGLDTPEARRGGVAVHLDHLAALLAAS